MPYELVDYVKETMLLARKIGSMTSMYALIMVAERL